MPSAGGGIVLVAPHRPPAYLGGIEVYTSWIAEALLSCGHEVTVVSIADTTLGRSARYAIRNHEDQGLTFADVSLGDSAWGGVDGYFCNTAIRDAVAEVCGRTRPLAVHVHGGFRISAAAIGAAKSLGLRTVVTLHDYYFACPRVNLVTPGLALCDGAVTAARCARCVSTPSPVTGEFIDDWMDADPDVLEPSIRAGRAFAAAALTEADAVLAPSECVLDTHRRLGLREVTSQVVRLGVPSRLHRWKQSSSRREQEVVHFAYIGHFSVHKGVLTLIQAANRLAAAGISFRLSVYGSRPSDAAYATAVQASVAGRYDVRFMPEYGPDRLQEIVEETDAIIIPSVWRENSPLVILAALRLGVPVIASRIGGIPEFVHDGQNGLLFSSGDAANLAEQMRRFALDRELRLMLASNAHYDRTSEREAAELLQIYLG